MDRRFNIFCLAILVFSVGIVYGQNSTNKDAAYFLNRASETIMDGSCLTFSFIASDSKGKNVYDNNGKIKISGKKYRLEIQDELLIISNEKDRWIYNRENEEIILSNTNLESPDIIENPFSIFTSSVQQKYSIEKAVDNITVLGKQAFQISLVPKEKKSYKLISIAFAKLLGTDSYYPLRIIIVAANGSKYNVFVNSFKELHDLKSVDFSFNPAHYPNAVVTDLR